MNISKFILHLQKLEKENPDLIVSTTSRTSGSIIYPIAESFVVLTQIENKNGVLTIPFCGITENPKEATHLVL